MARSAHGATRHGADLVIAVSLLPVLALLQVSLFVALARWALRIRAAHAELRSHRHDPAPTAAEAQVLADAERTAQIGSYGLDLATGAFGCSEELRRLLDLTPDQQLGSIDELLECVHPADREALSQAWEEAKRVGQPVTIEHRIVRPDGSSRWIDGRVRALTDGGTEPARLIGTMQDVSARRAVESALAHQALHDSLTGLPNRASFLGRLSQVMAHRQVRPSGLAVFFLDIDRFKWLNDSRGHAAGDELLVKIGRRLKATMRPGDTVSRFGGDEFVVLCEDVPTEQEALNLAARVAAVLRQPLEIGGEELAVTVSIGIAFLDADELSVTSEALVRDADAAMYEAKEGGRDRHEIFDASTRLAAANRHEMIEALRRGVAENQFVVHYQPVLDLVTRGLVGFEALVRWERPGQGLLSPDTFLNVAEETGLMIPIGGQVLRAACRQLAEWQEPGRAGAGTGSGLVVSVNLARRQLLDQNLPEVVQSALIEAGLLPQQLQLEITESILLSDGDASARAINRLRKLGVSIAVDDFGSCFSSLTFLKQFPVDVLKIDQAFVKGLGKEREDRAIVAGVVDLAHAFGLTTVAEGVETIEQLDELRAIGCPLGQGYLWSRPLPASEAEEWLQQHQVPSLVAVARPGTTSARQSTGAVEPGHRVLVVDDDRTYRQMLRLIVESGTGYRVVGEAGDGREAIALARNLAPDIILLDLAMPGMGGLEALPLLLAEVPDARVVVLSSLEPAYLLEKAGGTGAAAFCTKTDAPDTLLDALGPPIAA
jgi:diguanylate cyclase (GGDEF)-like protein/PAS domain S-box-containing protein